MIGKEIRSFHHLCRMLNEGEASYIFYKFNGNIFLGKIIRIGDKIFLLSHNFGARTKDFFVKNHFDKTIEDIIKPLCFDYNGIIAIDIFSNFEEKTGVTFFNLLPKDFEEMYEKFCKENKKQTEIINRKYRGMDTDIAKYLYCLCNGSKNYVFWAMDELYSHNVQLGVIKEIMTWVANYGQLIKDLELGTITAYKNHNSVVHTLREEMYALRKNKRINDVIRSFNTKQKKLLKERTLTEREKETLAKFGKISYTKKNNFIRKMSTVETAEEILKQMAYLVNIHFVWNKSAFIDYVTHTENLHADILMENGPIVLVKVNDYDAAKYLGKNTNWCISKNKTYWNQYTRSEGNAIQYMIFDFSKPEDDVQSIIGFTSKKNAGIVHAHDFCNHDLMGNTTHVAQIGELNSFLSHVSNNNNIFGIIKRDGIDINTVTFFDELPFKWTKQGFYDYLKKCFSKNEFVIVLDNDNKVVVSIRSYHGLEKLLQGNYPNNIDSSAWHNEHILFLDFSLPVSNPNKILFGIVHNNYDTYESYVDEIFDEHSNQTAFDFDSLLATYDLPYDFICRTNDVERRIVSALQNYSISVLDELMRNHKREVDKFFASHDHIELIENSIQESLNHMSSDLINVLYKHEYKLSGLMNKRAFNKLLLTIFNLLVSYKQDDYRRLTVPSHEEIDNFNENLISNAHEAAYIGYALALISIFEHEGNHVLIMFTSNYLIPPTSNIKSELMSKLIDIIFTKKGYKINLRDGGTDTLIAYVLRNNITTSKQCILQTAEVNESVAQMVHRF